MTQERERAERTFDAGESERGTDVWRLARKCRSIFITVVTLLNYRPLGRIEATLEASFYL